MEDCDIGLFEWTEGRSERSQPACYKVYRLMRSINVLRVSGLQVQKVNTCQPSFLSFLH